MSGRKNSVPNRQLDQMPASTVKANLSQARADAQDVTLAALAAAVGEAGAISDGDKGDITVTASGATWTIDAAVISAFGRTLTDDADATTARTTLGLGTAATTAASAYATASHSHAESDVTGLVADLALKAPIASPTLTGTPAAPTAAQGTNTTQIATTAYVRAEVAALVASAPGALDTLDELAAALGDDANFAATMTTALAGKQAVDAGLSSLAALGATAGLIEKTATDTYTERAIGVAATTSIPTRADADARFAAISHTHAATDLTSGIIPDARMPDLTGDVTTVDGAVATTIGANAVTDTKLRDSAALSVIGRSANSAGDPADIAASADGDVLRRAAGVLGFGAIPEASVTGLVSDLALKAPLASPTLTGTPLAPTAAADTNTTQIATTAYVIGQGATAAPAMDGAAAAGTSAKWAHGDHVHPTDTSLAPLASPALTGNPTAPTQTAANNSTRIATTAYADGAVTTHAALTQTHGISAFGATLVDDANAAAARTTLALGTMATEASATYAPIASPTFTGTPAAPTPAAGNDSTTLATTAFAQTVARAAVDDALANSFLMMGA